MMDLERVSLYYEVVLMVIACKVFELIEPLSFDEIREKLVNYKDIAYENIDGRIVETGWRILYVKENDKGVRGVIEESSVLKESFKGREFLVPISTETSFIFVKYGGRGFLIVFSNKRKADRIASRFSEIS